MLAGIPAHQPCVFTSQRANRGENPGEWQLLVSGAISVYAARAFLVERCGSQHSRRIWRPSGVQRHPQTSAKQSWGSSWLYKGHWHPHLFQRLGVSWWSFWLRSRRRTTTSATFWGGPHPVEFGWGLGSPLSTVYGVSRKGSVEGQEMRAPSSQHSDGKDVALLPARDADGIPGCSDPRVCLCPFPLLLLLLCLAQTTEIYFSWF